MNEEIRAAVHRWFEEVWKKRRTEAIHEMLAPDCIAHGLGDGTLEGPEAFLPFHAKFLGAFPDLHTTVEDVLVEGDRAAARFTCRGRHPHPDLGVDPTGLPVEFDGIAITRWRDGQIVEGWNVVDFDRMARQLRGE
jgi:predicted ester cyclase